MELYHDMASCYVDLSRYSDAECMYRKALVGKTELLGPDHESALLSARHLGLTYRRMKQYAEGEELMRHVIEWTGLVYWKGTLMYLVALSILQ